MPGAEGSISGEVATPENGLPTKIIVERAPSSAPALPNRASKPLTVAAIARTVRLSAAALDHQSPATTSSQVWMDQGRGGAAQRARR